MSQFGVGRLHMRVWEKVTAVSCRGGGQGVGGVGSFSGDATFTGTRARETGRGVGRGRFGWLKGRVVHVSWLGESV